jgi:hypothetical protein
MLEVESPRDAINLSKDTKELSETLVKMADAMQTVIDCADEAEGKLDDINSGYVQSF